MANSDSNNYHLPGKFLIAWNICYSDFKEIADLANNGKEIQNYDIHFEEESDSLVVWFLPRLLSDDMAKIYNKITLGRETKYWVDKNDYKITKRMFYK